MSGIAFYAPMKPPDHPVPSGDRRMARLLIAALATAGYEPELACRYRSHPGRIADPEARARQARIAQVGGGLARTLARRLARSSRRPKAWFSYHLYYKAPDHLGPEVAARLEIPYFVAEASFAPKRAGGPWDDGHRSVATAVRAARAVFCINPNDRACLEPLVDDAGRLVALPPFLDHAPYRAAQGDRTRLRKATAGRFGLPLDEPWLLAVGMMRPGDKLASYRLLAAALVRLPTRRWRLIVAGDGPARGAVTAAFAEVGVADRVTMTGELPQAQVADLYAAADLMAWPAVREAYGMALLEAQAAGLPVVAGRTDGVPATVAEGRTGLLVQPGDAAAFADALAALLAAPDRRAAMGAAAMARVEDGHTVAAAAAILRRTMEPHL
ncbi:MAG: glycosyltransferase family 4 protein [Alphaproteobacteria bacterium]